MTKKPRQERDRVILRPSLRGVGAASTRIGGTVHRTAGTVDRQRFPREQGNVIFVSRVVHNASRKVVRWQDPLVRAWRPRRGADRGMRVRHVKDQVQLCVSTSQLL